jgi:hypothetical protein
MSDEPIFTAVQQRELLQMLEDHKRRRWAWSLLGKVAGWVGSLLVAIEAAQLIIGKLMGR